MFLKQLVDLVEIVFSFRLTPVVSFIGLKLTVVRHRVLDEDEPTTTDCRHFLFCELPTRWCRRVGMVMKLVFDWQAFVKRWSLEDFDDLVVGLYRLIESHIRIFLISQIFRNQYAL